MQYGRLAGIDKPVSRLVLGTMIISAREPERSFELLDAVMERGGNAFDTANVYAGGWSERGLGDWLQRRGNREQVVILSKGCHPNSDRRRVTPADLTVDIYDSLARLKTDYVDGYMLHRDDLDVPVGPIVERFNAHLEAGDIHAFGGSNWTHARIAEANAYAEEHGLRGFTLSSPNYGLAEQVDDPWGPGCVSISGPQHREARAWYLESGVPVFAYSSLARGFFSGRIAPETWERDIEALDGAARQAYCHPINVKRLERAFQLAKKYGVGVPQIALAYILASPLEVYPLVGAANAEEYEQNLKAFDVPLSEQECDWLDLRRDAP